MTVELYCGDCLEIMKTMLDKSVDAVITDPPYGIGGVIGGNNLADVKYESFDWDDKPATAEQIIELRRISNNQVIFGGNYFVLPPSSTRNGCLAFALTTIPDFILIANTQSGP